MQELETSVSTHNLVELMVDNVYSVLCFESPAAAFFHENPASTHRLYPWLNREFRVLLGEEDMEFMIQIVMSLIDKYVDQVKHLAVELKYHW